MCWFDTLIIWIIQLPFPINSQLRYYSVILNWVQPCHPWCHGGGGRWLTRGGLVFGRPRSACVRLSVCMLDSKRRFLLFGPDTCAASFHKLVNNKLLLVIVIWCLSDDHFWTPDMRFCIERSTYRVCETG